MSLIEILEENENKEPPVKIETIISDYGVVIEYIPLNKINGMCLMWSKNWYIAINNFLPENKRRFTLAHEFAHVIQEDTWFSSYLISKFDSKEIEADNFASKILIPEKALLEQLEYTQDVWVPAKIFNVEKNIIKTRIRNLKF